MNFWDQNFSVAGFKYGTAPNAFLVGQAHRLKRGSEVLVPGDGEGRNGVWLAQQGHRVTAMDGSAVGLQKAQTLAMERDVALQTALGDLADWAPAPASFDAVVLTFVHLPPAIRAGAHRRLAAGLRPGGLLILESFHPQQLQHRSGGPKDVSMLYTPASLRDDFAGLDEVLSWHGETMLDEGPGHQGLAHVTRWIGQASA
ncbi:MAG: class I SAM-dependent methyltransferase [Gammaproteobacteria bacterium]|nr:class I SAM-dependent methyltransferase [Gammaproteobacteria bacterium]MBU4279730.1 class I SAM-dependent methyltransferase [Gammaproteobacteria bacterium]MBU4323663.1 class I SAM-dependent methyltransferase [Gammaproteobacteria bacterium]MBU4507425.1 class I SAM-dependent methyltransferase [Gammaproteobacteria bacterium]PKO76220.1 MAG: SAM-dependent methyltransferase [Betaproteobacteria bacterium HGW-Betaproteobacteria-15]